MYLILFTIYIWLFKGIVTINRHNKMFKAIETAIGEFDFLVRAIGLLKILKYSAPYVPAHFIVLQVKSLFFLQKNLTPQRL